MYQRTETDPEISSLSLLEAINNGLLNVKEMEKKGGGTKKVLAILPYILEVFSMAPDFSSVSGQFFTAFELAEVADKGFNKETVIKKGFALHQILAFLEDQKSITPKNCKRLQQAIFQEIARLYGSELVHQEEEEGILSLILKWQESESFRFYAPLILPLLYKIFNYLFGDKEGKSKKEEEEGSTVKTIKTLKTAHDIKNNLEDLYKFDEGKYQDYAKLINTYAEDSKAETQVLAKTPLTKKEIEGAKGKLARVSGRREIIVEAIKKDSFKENQLDCSARIGFDQAGESVDEAYKTIREGVGSLFEKVRKVTRAAIGATSDAVERAKEKILSSEALLKEGEVILGQLNRYEQIFQNGFYNDYAINSVQTLSKELSQKLLCIDENETTTPDQKQRVSELKTQLLKLKDVISESKTNIKNLKEKIDSYTHARENRWLPEVHKTPGSGRTKKEKLAAARKIKEYLNQESVFLQLNEVDYLALGQGTLMETMGGFLPLSPKKDILFIEVKIDTGKVKEINRQLGELTETEEEIDPSNSIFYTND